MCLLIQQMHLLIFSLPVSMPPPPSCFDPLEADSITAQWLVHREHVPLPAAGGAWGGWAARRGGGRRTGTQEGQAGWRGRGQVSGWAHCSGACVQGGPRVGPGKSGGRECTGLRSTKRPTEQNAKSVRGAHVAVGAGGGGWGPGNVPCCAAGPRGGRHGVQVGGGTMHFSGACVWDVSVLAS